jgi:outer membrane protein, multidrug efflux system
MKQDYMKVIDNICWPGLPLIAGAAIWLVGCSVGPDYRRPAPLGTNAVPGAFAGQTSADGAVWKMAGPAAHLPRGTWWECFGDAELNRLETLASAGNQQLAAAVANLDRARALVRTSRAGYFPQLSAAPDMTRQRTSANQFQRGNSSGSSSTYSTFSAPLDASWELDLWGRVRRSVEGAKARMAAAAGELESAKLSIQSEIAIDYFNVCALEAQHTLLEQTIEAYQRSLQLTQNRHQSGIATELDVAQAETQLRSAEAQLPAVELQRANFIHALATLCGQPASGFKLSPSKNALANFPNVPLSMPSELLEHRPDVAAAEQSMIAANADVGVAHAAFYPSVTLNGLAGFQSIDTGTLFNWESRLWSVGPSLQLPLFTGGRNRAQLAASRAAWEAATATYRQTVLNAFQEVEDQLAAQRLLAREHEAESAALKSARRTLEISTTRYKGGVITYLEVSIAQSTALAHEQTVVKLAAERLAASVSLIKALGAGWTSNSIPGPAAGKAVSAGGQP